MNDDDTPQVEPVQESDTPRKGGRAKGQKDKTPRKTRDVIIRPEHRGVLAHMTQGKTITEAMIAMSYTKATARNPKDITESKSWAMLMAEYLPEDLVAERHAELLNKRDTDTHTYGRGKNRRHEVVDRGPNVPAVGKALEMAYKLRGSFKSEAPPPPSTAIYNLFYQPHIMARVSAFEDALKESIAHEIVATDTGTGGTDDQSTTAITPRTDSGPAA